MSDDYRDWTKSMITCFWALSLFGAEQLVRVLTPGDAGVARRQTDALAAVTRSTATQFGAVGRGLFQAGEHLQRGMVDLLCSLVALKPATPRYMTRMSCEVMQQAAEVCRLLMPGQDNRLAWLEFKNKLQAFDLFEHVDVILQLPSGPALPLATLVQQADALGPYLAAWAMEGLGWHYAETYWEYHGTPQHLLTANQVRALPARSLIPLHTGMGLSLADRLLASLTPHSPDADVDTVLRQFMALCQHNAMEGYAGAVLEALGLVTRLRYPRLLHMVDERLAASAAESLGYFWHGVGRGLYFLPPHALPCSSSTWHAVEMAQQEAPHTLGRRNALGGLAWALTLVNLRYPAILEAVMQRYGEVLAAHEAFSTGVSGALMIWYDIAPGDPYLRAFMRYQPDPSNAPLVQLWNSQIREPAHIALQHYYGVLQARHSLGELFQHQPLAVLVERLKGEAVG
jgi:hypothetical protein